MPVRKFRSIEEMNAEKDWLPTGDPAVPRQIRYLWWFSETLLAPVGTCIPRGVRKYRSIEEAQADRDAWEQERINRLREARLPK
ncbi:MAG TPA: hypothetical protein VF824_10325 [Thermoanaerobaculia bacterium]|jgi:hypothetical protein